MQEILHVKRTERGWKAHFICAYLCRFSRNTLLEFMNKKYIVSTIGNYHPADKAEKINMYGYYETMVFEATYNSPYWDIDAQKEVKMPSESKWCVDTCDFNSDMEANDMHENAVHTAIILIQGNEVW